jgi:eukaryotic-like serine/threonine-protein kinase
LIGQTLDGKYLLNRLLGSGAMGAVYEARHAGTGRRVAVKVMLATGLSPDDQLIARFQREARAAGAIDTQHIVQVLDCGADPATRAPYMVMEYLSGSDLEDFLEKVGAIAPELALRIVAQACLGLVKAHEAGVVHRDIKPANLFLAKRDAGEVQVKVLDFGIAKLKAEQSQAVDATGLTRAGGILGSPLYMSPEQSRDTKKADHRTDLWSLGVVLYRALSGRAPLQDVGALGELILSLSTVPPQPVQEVAPWVPEEVAAIVHRALQIRPEDRYPTAQAMLDDVSALLPDGWALRETMLVSISDALRAPGASLPGRWSNSAAGSRDGMQGMSSAGGSMAPGANGAGQTVLADVRPGAPAIGATADMGGVGRTTSGAGRAPGRSKLGTAALVAILVAGAGSIVVYRTLAARRAAADDTRPTLAEDAPAAPADPGAQAPAATATRRVKLVVEPPDVSAEVDGVATPTKGGLVEIRAPLGSVHNVRLFKGGAEITGAVIVSEEGAIPPKMELAPAPGSGRLPPAGTGAATAATSAPAGPKIHRAFE